MTGLYPANLASHGPCRSLDQVKHDLIVERLSWLSRQMDAETQAEADYYARQIADIDSRLQSLELVTGAR